jgi:hypothetical protein
MSERAAPGVKTRKWRPNIDGVPVVPYRLPELIEAIGNERQILIVEGEVRVLALANLQPKLSQPARRLVRRQDARGHAATPKELRR